MPTVWLLAVPVLLLASGCAMQERQAVPFSPIVVADHYLKESRRKQLSRDKRVGFLLAAAHTSWNELRQGEARADARQIYNASAAELAVLLNKAPGRWNATTVIEGPRANYRVSFAPESRKQAIWNPGFFNEILAPAASKDKSSREVVRPEGFGGILVGVHRSEDPRKWLLPRVFRHPSLSSLILKTQNRPQRSMRHSRCMTQQSGAMHLLLTGDGL
jgi:hypothetical protein